MRKESDANIMETQSRIFSSLALPAHGQEGLRPSSGIPQGSILPSSGTGSCQGGTELRVSQPGSE